MANIIIYPYNILESPSSLTVTGSPDSGYPEDRLRDRSIDFYWKRTASATHEFEVDQGATGNLAVDFLAVSGHNFSGMTMEWQYSDNGSVWTDAVTDWSQSDNNLIVKTLSSAITHRYWKLIVQSAVNPQCCEIYMSKGYTFQVRFDEEPDVQDLDNVQWRETLGGLERSVKFGEVRDMRGYSFYHIPSKLSDFREAIGYLSDYSYPFFYRDHENNYKYARFEEVPIDVFMTEETTTKRVRLKEML